MIRAFSFSTAAALSIAFGAMTANAQGAPQAPAAPPPATAAPAAAAPAPAAPAPAAPVYGPAPQGEPPPGWGQPGAYPGWRAQPMEMRYIEGRPIPPGYHLETRVRKGLVVSGPIIFGIPYLLSISVAASSKYAPDRWLYAPVIGPFVNLTTRSDDCNPNSSTSGATGFVECTGESSARFFLMMDGVMQTAGATLLILGLALQQQLLVRDDAPFTGKNGSHFAWTVSPYATGKQGYGVGVVGIF
jgi:hypothetical protein